MNHCQLGDYINRNQLAKMNKVARIIANRFCKKRLIPLEQIEEFRFGIEIVLSNLLTFLTIFILGTILGYLWCTIAYIVVFITLRQFCEGRHAKTYLKCFLSTCSLFLLTLLLSELILYEVSLRFILLLLISNISIMLYKYNYSCANLAKEKNYVMLLVFYSLASVIEFKFNKNMAICTILSAFIVNILMTKKQIIRER